MALQAAAGSVGMQINLLAALKTIHLKHSSMGAMAQQ
jgi:hypothetical protein